MTDDIPALIERIDLAMDPQVDEIVKRHTLSECRAVLSRLTVSPLPGKPTIPAQITIGRGRFHPGVKVSTVQGAIDRMAARLDELERAAVSPQPVNASLPGEIAGLVDSSRASAVSGMPPPDRAKTIEECAQIADRDSATIIACRIAEAIRALKPSEE